MNYIKQINKLTLIIISLFLFLITIIVFHEDIVAEYKDIFNIKPLQYYGATVDMSQILPESENYVVNSRGEDLIDISAKLGINVFRITNIISITKDKETPSFTKDQWNQVLTKMRRKGLYAVILIEANNINPYFHKVELTDKYVNFVKNYIGPTKVCNFHNVLAIDIRNEPLLNENNLDKLKQASELVKASCPNTYITIGSWRTESGKKDASGEPEYNWHDPKGVIKLSGIVDLYSVHIYGFDKLDGGDYPDPYQLTSNYLKEIKKYTGNKPILIEEFGAGNGDSITDQKTLGSIELQGRAYEGVLKAAYDYKNKGVIGAIAYLLYPRSENPESWNILKNNGDEILPAAYKFKLFSNNY